MNVEAAPVAGRLTVPVYAPLVIALELNVPEAAVTDPTFTVIAVPLKVAAEIEFVTVYTPVTLTGKPLAETITEVPAGPVEGVRVTVGAVMVKVTATGAATASDICTLWTPGARLRPPAPPIMKYPLTTPAALDASCLAATKPPPVKVALPARPSTRTVNAPVASLAANPVPVTCTTVPLGPEAGEMLKVAEAEAEGIMSNGSANEISRMIVNIDAFVVFVFKGILWINLLSIFLFSPFMDKCSKHYFAFTI